MYCAYSAPPRHKVPVSPLDVCSKGLWAARKRTGEFMYDNPVFISYTQAIKILYDESVNETDIVIVPILKEKKYE